MCLVGQSAESSSIGPIEPIDLGIAGLAHIERIGAGGNAVVYRARQVALDRDVVIKVITAVDVETVRRRFDRERRAMGRLSQVPGIAPVYDSGYTPAGQPWIIMPHFERGSLQDVLDANGALPAARVRSIGIRIAQAVQLAHERGVLHRDLKPANILMSLTGEPNVADFGIAHLLDDSQGVTQGLTMTPLYTAPEVFDGVDAGARSDVYSLGALLYALAAGRPAFAGSADHPATIYTLMRRISEQALAPLPATVPQGLAAVIAKAMAKEPEHRYQSATALGQALAEADLSVEAAAATGMSGSALATAEEDGQGVATSRVEPRSPGRASKVLLAVAGLAVVATGAAAAAWFTRDSGNPTVPDTGTSTDADADTRVPVEPGQGSASGLDVSVEDPDGNSDELDEVDFAVALAAATDTSVLVEGYSCTGVAVAPGVVLADGRVLTDSAILLSPWFVGVTQGDKSVRASPLTMDLNRSLGLVEPTGPLLARATHGRAESGDHVLFVEPDAVATPSELAQNPDGQLISALPLEQALSIAHASPVFGQGGELVGTAIEAEHELAVLHIDDLESGWNRVPPRWTCPTLFRELGSGDAAEIVHPHIGELMYLQRLSDAYAAEDWDSVREWEPAKQSLSDAEFIDRWRPLRQGFVYPVERTSLGDGRASWRIGLIGHETWSEPLTTLSCVTWEVEGATGEVVQVLDDSLTVFGSQPAQPHNRGTIDPGDLIDQIGQSC